MLNVGYIGIGLLAMLPLLQREAGVKGDVIWFMWQTVLTWQGHVFKQNYLKKIRK